MLIFKIIIYICTLIFNFSLLFLITPKYESRLIIALFGKILAIIIFIAMMINLFITSYFDYSNPWVLFYVSTIIILMVNIINKFIISLVDKFITFHKTYNANNLNRNPIKFVKNNPKQIKNCYTALLFLFSIIGLYGVYFDNIE